MKEVGIAELKAKLSEYLEIAKKGVRLVITDRGKPVAELGAYGALPSKDHEIEEIAMRRLAQSGGLQLRKNNSSLRPHKRTLRFEGTPFSDQIVQDRGD